MNTSIINRAISGLGIPKSGLEIPKGRLSAPSNCPDCGKAIAIVYDYNVVVTFPALMGLDQMVICNDCADFRTALRETQEALQNIIQRVRFRGQDITSKSQQKAIIQGNVDILTKEFTPFVEILTHRLMRILSRRSGRPQLDKVIWAQKFMSIWDISATYAGDLLMRVQSDDQTWSKLKELQKAFGIRLVHHGKKPVVDSKPPQKEVEDFPEP